MNFIFFTQCLLKTFYFDVFYSKLTAEDWAVSDSEGETNDRKKEYMQQLKAWFK